MRNLILIIIFILITTSCFTQTFTWQPIGPDDAMLTNLYLDAQNDLLFVSTYEGFRYYNLRTEIWTNRDDTGWIGRTVYAIINHTDPSRIITGRVNAFFKGYMEISYIWGVTDELTYTSNGGAIRDVQRDPFNDSTYFACGFSDVVDGELLKSTDAGETWQLLTNYYHHAMTEIAVDETTQNMLYVSGSSLITRSTDNGATWHLRNTGLPVNLGVYSVSVSPFDSNLLLCSNDNGIYRSTNAGEQWNYVTSYCCQHFAFNPVCEDIVAAVTFSPYSFIISQDGGQTWLDWTQNFPAPVMKDLVFAEDGNTIYVASRDNGVYAAELFQFDVEDYQNIDIKPFSAITPNPTKGSFQIYFSIPERGDVDVTIYSLKGEKVADKKMYQLNQGVNSISFELLDGIATGMYMYRIKAHDFYSNGTFVLIK